MEVDQSRGKKWKAGIKLGENAREEGRQKKKRR